MSTIFKIGQIGFYELDFWLEIFIGVLNVGENRNETVLKLGGIDPLGKARTYQNLELIRKIVRSSVNV